MIYILSICSFIYVQPRTVVFKASPNIARIPAYIWIHGVTPERAVAIWISAEVFSQEQVTLRKQTWVRICFVANMRCVHLPTLTQFSTDGGIQMTQITSDAK